MNRQFVHSPPNYTTTTQTNTNAFLDLPRIIINPRRKLFFEHSKGYGSDYIQLPPPCRTIPPGLQEWIAPRTQLLFGRHRPPSCSRLLNFDKEADLEWYHARQASSGHSTSDHRYSPYVSRDRIRDTTERIRPSASEEHYGQGRESTFDDLSDDSRDDQPDEEERRLWESWHYHQATMERRTGDDDGLPLTGTTNKPLGRDLGSAFDPPAERHGRDQIDARHPGGPKLRPAAWHDVRPALPNTQRRHFNTQGYLEPSFASTR